MFPESHCLAEGACVCSEPGRWCQVVHAPPATLAASSRNETGQLANWNFGESALSLCVEGVLLGSKTRG